MKLQSEVKITWPAKRLTASDCILALGSCFSAVTGKAWVEAGLPGCYNPFGVLFNPISVLDAMKRLDSNNNNWLPKSLFHFQGFWRSFMFHGAFNHPDKDAAESKMQTALAEGQECWRKATWLFISWGTALVWQHNGTPNQVVANCQKCPQSEFSCRLLSAQEITERYIEFLNPIFQKRPGLNIMLTVSPVRHSDRAEARNAVSKAHLQVAADLLVRKFPGQIHYFPAYELLMDELRDYRFFADDFSHPSPLAENVIQERFLQNCATPEVVMAFEKATRQRCAAAHRPLHPENPT